MSVWIQVKDILSICCELWLGGIFYVFSFLFGTIVLGGGAFGVPLCARVCGSAHVVLWKWFSFCFLGFLFPVCVHTFLSLLCPLYVRIGVVLLSPCVWVRCIPCGFSLDFVFVLCKYRGPR